jgi:hypothetical protein
LASAIHGRGCVMREVLAEALGPGLLAAAGASVSRIPPPGFDPQDAS